MIEDTIQSVLSQSYKEFELIIVDDGSTDNTQVIIERLVDSRIRYIHQNNYERGMARNRGIYEAKGRFVLFLDSDDQMLPYCLDTLAQAIALNPEAGILSYAYYKMRDGKKQKVSVSDQLGEIGIGAVLLKGNPFACNFCIDKTQKVLSLFNEDREYSIMEDWMFLIVNTQNILFHYIDIPLIILNDHNQRSMRSNNETIIQRRIRANDWILCHIKLSPKEAKVLMAYTKYFCAIHSYIDHNFISARKYLSAAAGEIGWDWDFRKLQFKIFLKRMIK
ncbi:MAG: glycosyltransferase family 2 protein [Bacteroidetes bacterium]|nr:glycosyltransferase family 2 protein [Bacteroidota bacterium]